LPNFYVYRPADGVENVKSWQKALSMKHSPSAFVCSRQNLPLLPSAVHGDVENGGYLLVERKDATVTLMASGSEVGLALESAELLSSRGIAANVVSIPCFDLLLEQPQSYIDVIIKSHTKKIAIEAARGLEWYRFADTVVAMDGFGASAPADKLFEKFGFTAEAVAAKI
jgi:transketolase